MNLKTANKIVKAYKLACSDGVAPTNDFDWQPSPMGYKLADLMLACRVVGTSIEELKSSATKKEEIAPVVVEEKKIEQPKAEKKEEPKSVVKEKVVVEEKKEEEPKAEISFKDEDGDGISDYRDPDYKANKNSLKSKSKSKK